MSSFSLVSASDPNITIRAFSYSNRERERVSVDAITRVDQMDGGVRQVEYVGRPVQKHVFDLPETPVIVGVDWTPDHITVYIDGHVVRQLDNDHWHSPMRVSFSLSSTDGEGRSVGSSHKWWGCFPNSRSTVNGFHLYYVRCWHRYPDHRKMNAPGVLVSPTHHEKTSSNATHRSAHYLSSSRSSRPNSSSR